ncbi:diphthine--ammonia ligase [Flavobacterium agricola]|uniref:Diphthine--ammonia ligase n=1 Tax=Flavobacterium agricola TaxID=2870839 RepID=A0ABY6M0U7_9FLAO|nr:diphthine--ammonia ligase [Flavobacterium agricola]UYW01877.1 diphthine--ammonia ligase [Flavobacterium agricola]
MTNKKKAVFNWSGGKDSAHALQKILQENEYEVIALLTTVEASNNASSIHAIPLNLLHKQADCIGIPLYPILLDNKVKPYDESMQEAVLHFKNLGVAHFIFGDIFLEDIKTYRESKLNPLGISVIFPLWGKTSEQVFADFLQSGIKTKVIVTQADKLNQSFIGRDVDFSFLEDLPQNIDVCGEYGEYHTFSYDGPLFKKPVAFTIEKTLQITHQFKMDTGKIESFHYWQAKLS